MRFFKALVCPTSLIEESSLHNVNTEGFFNQRVKAKFSSFWGISKIKLIVKQLNEFKNQNTIQEAIFMSIYSTAIFYT